MVFDRWDMPEAPYSERFRCVDEWHRCYRVEHHYVSYAQQITDLEERYLAAGFEGVMIRDPDGPYKQGRSTTREGWLLKVKRFEDSEALVIGMEEKMHNANEATVNALGHTERSSHIANLKPMDTLGALIVRDIKTGVEFNIGTGFDDMTRKLWWERYKGDGAVTMDTSGCTIIRFPEPVETVTYTFFPSGSKDKPRFPVYKGIRKDL
jgi:DNA ligase-1